MPYGPQVQDALQGSLCGLVAVELDVRVGSWDVDTNLMPDGFIQAPCLSTRSRVRSRASGPLERLANTVEVLFALPLEGRHTAFAVGGKVAEEELPGDGANLLRNARPGQRSQLREGNGRCLEELLELVYTGYAGVYGVGFFGGCVCRDGGIVDEVKGVGGVFVGLCQFSKSRFWFVLWMTHLSRSPCTAVAGSCPHSSWAWDM